MSVKKIVDIPEDIKGRLKKAGYGVYAHGTIEVCHWTKKSLRNQGVCYKRVFYGIDTHRCVEFSPAGMMCHFRCIFCWRPTQFMKIIYMDEDEVLNPIELMEGLLKERKRLMSGYPGTPAIDKDLLKEALDPTHYAISLSGEPTLYTKLPELIKYLKSLPKTRSIFLVTNGAEPNMLKRLEEEDALPTQLYLSLNAPNKELFTKIVHPMVPNAWKSFLESLKFLSKVKTRTIIRMTMIRGWNTDEKYIPEYAKLIHLGSPHFLEIKSYMHIGFSTRRLNKENMLFHNEIRDYSMKLLNHLKTYAYMDEYPPSRIVVLQNKYRYVNRWIP